MFLSIKQNSNYQGRRICFKYSPEEISLFKKKIRKEFYSFFDVKTKGKDISKLDEDNSYPLKEEESKIYYKKYTHYIFYTFNSSIVNMIILYFNKNKSLLTQYKLEENFIYNLIRLLKHLLMNEIEVAHFTLLLDNLGGSNEQIDLWIYLIILGILTKKSLSKENDFSLLLNVFSKKYPNLKEVYFDYVSDENVKKKIAKKRINISLINKRFNELTKPINSYCRENYIILDGILDKIISLSHPYEKKDNSKKNDNDKSNKFLIEDMITNLNIKKEIDFENIRNIEFDKISNFNLDENIFYDIENSGSLHFDDI